MAMCLRCMQEGRYVDATDCDHATPSLTTHRVTDADPEAGGTNEDANIPEETEAVAKTNKRSTKRSAKKNLEGNE